ncbi:hypothetical protein ACFRK5_21295 [Streptomyces niveus]|uniref:hypothetical protein n=1 Tax=Streptomyces niveus TaxID=193462 RepID=UPI0036533270
MTFPYGFFQRPAVARIDNYLTGDVENHEADQLLASRLPTSQWRAGSSRSLPSGENPGAYAAIATPPRNSP